MSDRHMTKGQQAMAVAMVYPEAKRGRGNKDPSKETQNISFTYIKKARFVIQHTPGNAQAVLNAAIEAHASGEIHMPAPKNGHHGNKSGLNVRDYVECQSTDTPDLFTRESLHNYLAMTQKADKPKRLVNEEGMTQQQAADALGVSQDTVSKDLKRNTVATQKVCKAPRKWIGYSITQYTKPETAAQKIIDKFGNQFALDLSTAALP